MEMNAYLNLAVKRPTNVNRISAYNVGLISHHCISNIRIHVGKESARQ
jgi:hypothetical protein